MGTRTDSPGGLRPGSLVTLEVSDGSRPVQQSQPTSTSEAPAEPSPRSGLPSIDTSELEELTNRLRERLGA